MQIHLFGAATPSGEAYRQLAASAPDAWPLHVYSRSPSDHAGRVHPADFNTPSSFVPAGPPGSQAIWISFGPIWLLAPFLAHLAHQHPERLQGLRGLVACSSSSALTKRFAANRLDRELAARLTAAEEQLIASCRHLTIPCRLMQPTLIYGQVGPYADRNLGRLRRLMRRLPLLPLPAPSGLRQPIHASQLAAVAMHLTRQLGEPGSETTQSERIAVGGDYVLSYHDMLVALQQALPPDDQARRCHLLPIPHRLALLLATPLLLRSPRSYEAVGRMSADLAGFTPSHGLLKQPPQPFPLQPLA